jgi:hypothetical protein
VYKKVLEIKGKRTNNPTPHNPEQATKHHNINNNYSLNIVAYLEMKLCRPASATEVKQSG